MRSGELDKQIDLMRPQETRGAAGGVSVAYVRADTVFAKKVDAPTPEKAASGAIVSGALATFKIYFRDDIRPDWRVRFPAGETGALYEIAALVEIGAREALMITATAEYRRA